MYIHASDTLINKNNFIPKYENQFGSNKLFYNPKGLWYSCNNKWNNDRKYNYNVNISNLHILKIKTLKELDEFNINYFNPNFNSISTIINWDKVYQTYDGLEICPYLIKNKVMKSLHFSNNDEITFNDKTIINNIILGKRKNIPKKYNTDITNFLQNIQNKTIKDKFIFKQISRIWCIGWEIPSGVIWKNYKKLELKLIHI